MGEKKTQSCNLAYCYGKHRHSKGTEAQSIEDMEWEFTKGNLIEEGSSPYMVQYKTYRKIIQIIKRKVPKGIKERNNESIC